MTNTSNTTTPPAHHAGITITMTETVVNTYILTTDQLASMGLPTTVTGLTEYDTETLAGALLQEVVADDLAVTERDLEIQVTPGEGQPGE
jgi:hypothetical protein